MSVGGAQILRSTQDDMLAASLTMGLLTVFANGLFTQDDMPVISFWLPQILRFTQDDMPMQVDTPVQVDMPMQVDTPVQVDMPVSVFYSMA